jgi:asparagine synthase (glutamine-hydrolysing)
MCGIAGFLTTARGEDRLALDATRRMVVHMHRRGPDAEDVWASSGVVLGHRRLSILDLDARSNQPMVSADGRYTIVFNGEIYNYRELRRALESDGETFRTTSDTEVLLRLFAREGRAMLPRLRWMFAFAIWDGVANELFLARDPYGIKPLYYAQAGTRFLFASQVKALLASGLVGDEPEPAGLAGFYLWGSVPEPWTLFRGLLALPAGHSLIVRDGVSENPRCWRDIRSGWRGESRLESSEELGARVRHELTESVRAHLVADVPVSVFLSGGIDSAAIAGLAAGLGASVEGITLAFDEYQGQPGDEAPVAAAIARHYQLPHFVRRVSRAEFHADVPEILNAMDQPSVDGINTWFASKAAAERGYKVALSGVGGDELFCGYSTFVDVPRLAAVGRAIDTVPTLRALLRRPCEYLSKGLMHPKLAGVPSFAGTLEGAYFLTRALFLPHELPALMGVEAAREGLARLGGSPAGIAPARALEATATVGMFESAQYLRNQLLRDADWASMGHSIELRTPMVDSILLDALGSHVSAFRHGAGKAMVARSPVNPLPESVTRRAKAGFRIPIDHWARGANSIGEPASAASSTQPWARRWAMSLMGRMAACA